MTRDDHQDDPDAREADSSPDKRPLVAIGLFSLVYFVGAYALAVHWYRQGLFVDWDFFFDADAGVNLKAMSLGGGRYAFSHPLLELLKIPVLSIGFVVGRIFGMPLWDAGRYVALGVSPLFASLGLLALYGTLVRLKVASTTALMITVAFTFWNSNLLFSAIPETFTMSRAFMTACFFWLLAPSRGRWWNVGLFLVGLGMAGVTITNLAIFFIAAWFARARHEPWKKAAIMELARSAAIFVTALGVQAVAIVALGKVRGSEGSIDWLKVFLKFELETIGTNIMNLVGMFTNMIVAIEPARVDYGWSFMHGLSGGFVLILLLAFGLIGLIAGSVRNPPAQAAWPWLSKACLAIIGFNFALHSFFGREMFLYTQHWIVPTLLLLIPVLTKAPRIVLAVTVVIAAVNLNFMSQVQSHSAQAADKQAKMQMVPSAPVARFVQEALAAPLDACRHRTTSSKTSSPMPPYMWWDAKTRS